MDTATELAEARAETEELKARVAKLERQVKLVFEAAHVRGVTADEMRDAGFEV